MLSIFEIYGDTVRLNSRENGGRGWLPSWRNVISEPLSFLLSLCWEEYGQSYLSPRPRIVSSIQPWSQLLGLKAGGRLRIPECACPWQDKATLISLALSMSSKHRPEQKTGVYSSVSAEEGDWGCGGSQIMPADLKLSRMCDWRSLRDV